MLINIGTQERVIAEAPASAGTTVIDGSIRSDSLLATLWVNSSAGDLDVTFYTLTDTGRESELFHFPTLSSGTTDPLLKKSGVSLQRFRIRVSYTGACDYEIYVRAISGVGESSTRIISSNDWKTSQQDVTTTPAILIAASLTDRNGVLVKNWDGTGTVYIAESLVKADPSLGYPLAPKDALAMDIAAGATIYAVGTQATVDIRIVESGG